MALLVVLQLLTGICWLTIAIWTESDVPWDEMVTTVAGGHRTLILFDTLAALAQIVLSHRTQEGGILFATDLLFASEAMTPSLRPFSLPADNGNRWQTSLVIVYRHFSCVSVSILINSIFLRFCFRRRSIALLPPTKWERQSIATFRHICHRLPYGPGSFISGKNVS